MRGGMPAERARGSDAVGASAGRVALCGVGLRIRGPQHGMPWSREELTVAWEACPKDFQRYGPRDPRVIEVAELLGRSPGAVSRIFGNLWWFYSRGTLGLAHGSRIADQVVAAYGNDLGHLAEVAFDLRAGLVRESPWPRLLIRSEAPEQSLAYGALAEAASEAGLDPQDVFVNIRRGSILEDIFVFVSANPGVSVDLVTRLLRSIESLVKTIASRPITIIRSEGFEVILKGDAASWKNLLLRRYELVPSLDEQSQGERVRAVELIISKSGIVAPRSLRRSDRRQLAGKR